jgi:hypothetical protein
MYFLYKNEYGIFKPVEINKRRGTKIERRTIEGMNKFGLLYIYIYIYIYMERSQ